MCSGVFFVPQAMSSLETPSGAENCVAQVEKGSLARRRMSGEVASVFEDPRIFDVDEIAWEETRRRAVFMVRFGVLPKFFDQRAAKTDLKSDGCVGVCLAGNAGNLVEKQANVQKSSCIF